MPDSPETHGQRKQETPGQRLDLGHFGCTSAFTSSRAHFTMNAAASIHDGTFDRNDIYHRQ